MIPKKFINPYTFVSLDEKCDKNVNLYYKPDEKKLTGYIECELENLTEMFIPNTNKKDIKEDKIVKDHKIYSFFKKDDKPVIPGSSLRGVIRSVYETITNSCLSTTNDESFLHRRYPDASKAGLIINDGGKIYLYDNDNENLTKVKLEAISNIKDLSRVDHLDKGKVRYNPKANNIIFRGNKGLSKKVAIFKRGNKVSELTEEQLKRLNYLLYLYDNENNSYLNYRHLLRKVLNGQEEMIPVYYKKGHNTYYLSPACITREVFENTLKKILELNGNYQPCTDVKSLCSACALFGTTNLEKNDLTLAIGSRIRFTDAYIEKQNDDYFMEYMPLKELSSPKISSVEFYMFKPDVKEKVDSFNYDYLFNWENNKNIIKNVLKTDYLPRIRGRKYYWHHHNYQINQIKNNKKSKLNISAELLKRGQTFTFKVYFDKVTKMELNQLLWALDFDNPNIDASSYFRHPRAHKIGMGKPLGLGSCMIKVKNIKVRDICIDNDKINYIIKDLKRNEIPKLEIKSMPLRELFEIASFIDNKATDKMAMRRKDIDVKYPYVELAPDFIKQNQNDDAGHQWFNENRGPQVKEKIKKTLPQVGFTDENNIQPLYLETYIRKQKNKPNKSNYNRKSQNKHKRY